MIKKKLCMFWKRFLYSCKYQRLLLRTLYIKLEGFYFETGIENFCQVENLNYFLKLCMSKESHLIIPGDFQMIQKDVHVAQKKVWYCCILLDSIVIISTSCCAKWPQQTTLVQLSENMTVVYWQILVFEEIHLSSWKFRYFLRPRIFTNNLFTI